MEITQITLRKQFTEGALKAVFSITFDNELALHDVKLIETDGKAIVVMPNRKNGQGKFIDVAHPINSQFRRKLEKQVLNYFADSL